MLRNNHTCVTGYLHRIVYITDVNFKRQEQNENIATDLWREYVRYNGRTQRKTPDSDVS